MKLLLLILFFTASACFAQTPKPDSLVFSNVNFSVIYSKNSASDSFYETYENSRLIMYGDSIILPDHNRGFNVSKTLEVTFQSGGHGWIGGIAGFFLGMAVGISVGSTGKGGHPDLGPVIGALLGGVIGSGIGTFMGMQIPGFTTHSFEDYTTAKKKRMWKKYLREYKLN